jgi:hypothetical protein
MHLPLHVQCLEDAVDEAEAGGRQLLDGIGHLGELMAWVALSNYGGGGGSRGTFEGNGEVTVGAPTKSNPHTASAIAFPPQTRSNGPGRPVRCHELKLKLNYDYYQA